MNYIKTFKRAGELTDCLPIQLCEQARNSLKIWQYTSLEEMRERLRLDIESLNRFEYRAIDDAGNVKAMMIIDVHENEPHTGHDILYTKFSFSTEPGALAPAYKWLIQLAKLYGFKFIMTTRQTGPLEIVSKIKEIKSYAVTK